MINEGLKALTEKEREGLRLVPQFGTLGEIASHIGISESALKQRLASACRKLNEPRRHKAALILLDAEGWPYPIRTGPNEQVVAEERPSFSEIVEPEVIDASPAPSMREDRTLKTASGLDYLISALGALHDLSPMKRLAGIAITTLLGLLIFSMVIATMTETGRFRRSIAHQPLER